MRGCGRDTGAGGAAVCSCSRHPATPAAARNGLAPPSPPPLSPQTDIHVPQTTVEEALAFSAHLRLPATVEADTRHAFVEEVRAGGVVAPPATRPPTHPPTYPPTHPPTRAPTHPPTHSPTLAAKPCSQQRAPSAGRIHAQSPPLSPPLCARSLRWLSCSACAPRSWACPACQVGREGGWVGWAALGVGVLAARASPRRRRAPPALPQRAPPDPPPPHQLPVACPWSSASG